MTDSYEASKDGRKASGDSFDVGGHGAPGSAVPAPGRARALWGSRKLTRK